AGAAEEVEDAMAACALEPLADAVRHPGHLEHLLGGAVRGVEGAAVVVGRLHQALSEKPPSTISVWPRIISAAGEQRNATASAMSSGRTSLPAGLSRPKLSISSLFGKCSSAPVSTTPPETPFARIPSGASSTARYRISASSAAFEVPTTE